MAAKHYTVTTEYVTVKTDTSNGPMVVGLYQGAPVPGDASPEWIEHHLSNDLIAEVGKVVIPAGDDAKEDDDGDAKAKDEGAKAPPGPRPAQAAQHRGTGGRP